MNNGRLTIALIILIGVMIYLLIPDNKQTPASNSSDFAIEEQEILEQEMELASSPPVELSREEEAARKALRDLNLEEGSVGDKMLNFLLSGQMRFSKEIYEVKNNQYENDGSLTTSIEEEFTHLAAIMQAYASLQIEIVSHTGKNLSWEEQRKLTENRAKACKAFLIAQDKNIAKTTLIANEANAQ